MTKAINKKLLGVPFFRFRNCNDIVGVLPFGTGSFIKRMRGFFSDSKVSNMNSIFDFGVIGKGIRVDSFGIFYKDPENSPNGVQEMQTVANSFWAVANLFRLPAQLREARNDDDTNALGVLHHQNTVLNILASIFMPSAIFDHIPSGYAKHISIHPR